MGAYTHGVALSREEATELQTVIGMMTELHYIKKEEIPLIPHRSEPMRFVVYSPLAGATFDAEAFAGFLAEQTDLGTKWPPRFVRVSDELPVTTTNKVSKRGGAG